MPISIILTLRSTTDTILSHRPPLGRANYAQMLAHIQAVDHDLGATIHDTDGLKPLTCSALLRTRADRKGIHIRKEREYQVRVTGLSPAVDAVLARVLLDDPPTHWRISNHTFQLIRTVCDPAIEPWSGRISYEALAAGQLVGAARPERRVTFDFRSPVSFKSKGMFVPVPLPSLVFGSLVERWNAFSPVTLSPEMRRFGDEMIALSNYQLQTRPVIQKNGAPIIGGLGKATYTALGGDRYWLSVMQMLANFALYSGVGVKTATGMGQARKI